MAHLQGKVALVWVDETRPVLQGSRLTAWECVRDGIPQGGAAVVRLAIVAAVALGLAVWSMRRMKLSGASD